MTPTGIILLCLLVGFIGFVVGLVLQDSDTAAAAFIIGLFVLAVFALMKLGLILQHL